MWVMNTDAHNHIANINKHKCNIQAIHKHRYAIVCICVYLDCDLKLLGFRHDSLWYPIFQLHDIEQRIIILLKNFTTLAFCIPRSVWVRKRPERATGSRGISYFVSQGTLERHALESRIIVSKDVRDLII